MDGLIPLDARRSRPHGLAMLGLSQLKLMQICRLKCAIIGDKKGSLKQDYTYEALPPSYRSQQHDDTMKSDAELRAHS